jgi:hypothetical protein
MNSQELADYFEYELKDVFPYYTLTIQMLRQLAELQKPLTDEEIEQCFADACTDFKLLENGTKKGIVNIIDVGRAIEERHGIK